MPKIGDILPLENCAVCGGPQYKEWTSVHSYHNDSREEWVSHRHNAYSSNYGDDHKACVKYLAGKIHSLEIRALR